MMLKLTILALFFAGVLVSSPLDTGLWGVVWDPSGAVVTDASIIALNESTGVRRSVYTDRQGIYTIASVPAGSYKIVVRKEGFLTAAKLGVAVDGRLNVRSDFILRIGLVEETVNVEGRPSLINTESGSLGTRFDSDVADKLPVGARSLAGLLDLTPGVVTTAASSGEAGQFSASGQRPNTNYLTVDGVSLSTGVTGAGRPGLFSGGTLPAMTAIGSLHNVASGDSIEEVRVQTSSFTPDFGRMPGAQITVTTRSGSNDFHGALFDSFQNNGMSANDWFANSAGLRNPKRRVNEAGISIGGPMRRDHTFFFASLEQLDLQQPYVWQTAVPAVLAGENLSPASLALLKTFPVANGTSFGDGTAKLTAATSHPGRVRVGSLRLDHAWTSRISLFARYSASPSSSQVGFSQVNRSSFRQQNVTGGATAALGSYASNDLRFNWTSASVRSDWIGNGAGGVAVLDLSSWTPWATPTFSAFSIGGLGTVVAGDGGRSSQNQINIVDTLAMKQGAHHLRFGVDYQQLRPRREGPSSSLTLDFATLADFLSGRPGWLNYAQSRSIATRIQIASLFAQDTWMLTPRLMMTYGVRWEIAPAPLSQQGHGLYSGSGSTLSTTGQSGAPLWRTGITSLAPRIGIAYRLTANGRSVFRAGFGVFIDTSFAASLDEINGEPFNSLQLNPPYVIAPVNSPPQVRYGFDNHLRLPRSLEWNATWQHGWGNWAVTSLSYVGAQGTHLLRREATLQPVAEIAELELETSHGTSSYNGLQAEYRQRLTHGLQGLVSYSWSHSIDTGSWDSSVFLVPHGTTAANDRASSNFDARHLLTSALAYDVKLPRGPRFLATGWGLSGVLHARTGFPVDVLAADTFDGFALANVVRPNLIAGLPVWIQDPNAPAGRRLNGAAFSLPPNNLQGSLGRNAIRGFGMSQLDIAAQKTLSIRDRATLEIRCEALNILNHPNFADPERFMVSPLFGQPTSMLNLMLGSGTPYSGLSPALQLGAARVVQLRVKLRF